MARYKSEYRTWLDEIQGKKPKVFDRIILALVQFTAVAGPAALFCAWIIGSRPG